MAEKRWNGWMLPIGFAAGGILGVLLVRAFFLDSIEEIGWRMFWSGVGNGQVMNMETVLGSATFAKCVCGFLLMGTAVAFGLWTALKNRNPSEL